MFADYVKMGAKAVALTLAAAVVIGFMTSFEIPSVNMSFVSDSMNKVYTIGQHYIPFFTQIWALGVTLFTLELTILGARFALITAKWVIKINE